MDDDKIDHVTIPPDRARHLVRAVMQEEHGPVEQQKDALVADIACVLNDPDRWPMTDAQRIEIIKKWYRMAVIIRSMER